MIRAVEDFIAGNECPRCGFDKLYQLADQRFKCALCRHKQLP
ncbi:MAG: transposase [Fidelibacterota bacterium]